MLGTKMRLISLTIVLSLLANSVALADCPPAVNLKVGDKVTDCERVGVAKDTMAEIDKQLVEGDYNKKIISEQERVIQLKDLRISESDQQSTLWKGEAIREREVSDKERSRTSTSFWIGMGSGLLLVLGAAWAVKQVGR